MAGSATPLSSTFFLTFILLVGGAAFASAVPHPDCEDCVVTPRPRPDLVIASLYSTNPDLQVGEATTIVVSTKNIGNAAARNSTTRLQTDAGDYYFQIPRLLRGQNHTNYQTYTCTEPGVHAFTATADFFNNVSESNESNNGRTLYVNCTQPLLPDLVGNATVNSSEVYIGDTLNVSLFVRNVGNGSAGPSFAHVSGFFQPDQGPPPGGFVGVGYVPPLFPGESFLVLNDTPTCEQPGLYNYSVTADFYNNVSESNESNNRFNLLFRCEAPALPDLVVAEISFNQSSVYVGDTVGVSIRTQNAGTAAAGSSVTRYRHAYGYVNFAVGPLPPNASAVNTTAFTCYYAGTFYFNATADYYGNVSESNESNNFRQTSLTCLEPSLPDLTASLAFSDASPRVGDTLYVIVGTHNNGTATAGQSHTNSYEVPSGIPHSAEVPMLPPGTSFYFNYSFTCSNVGWFYFNASADAWGEVSESNEGNNFDFQGVYCNVADLPDLVVQDIAFSNNNPRVGDAFTVNVTTGNIGSNASGRFTITAVFHNNGADYLYVPPLPPGYNHTNFTTYTCNQTGTVFFSANADYWGWVNESNESNNWRQESVYCAPAELPDLYPYMSFSDYAPRVGDTVVVYVNTTNYGQAASNASVTISQSIDDVFVGGFFFIPSLPPWGGWHLDNYSFTCPYPGAFWFNATADYWGQNVESNESNTAWASLTCFPAQPDLVISNLSFSNSSPQVGDVVTVYGTTLNNGTGPTLNASKTVLNYVGGYWEFSVPPLNAGGYAVHGANFTCNQTGWFTFWGTADVYNNVSESNESNNWRQQSVYCAPAQNQSLPDLVAKNLSFELVNEGEGFKNYSIRFLVTNEGNGTATSGFLDRLYFGDGTHYDNIPASLDPGESFELVLHHAYDTSNDSYVLSGYADFFGQVNETDESNNDIHRVLFT